MTGRVFIKWESLPAWQLCCLGLEGMAPALGVSQSQSKLRREQPGSREALGSCPQHSTGAIQATFVLFVSVSDALLRVLTF